MSKKRGHEFGEEWGMDIWNGFEGGRLGRNILIKL